jgi:uncharacterized protein (TIGR02147 family)
MRELAARLNLSSGALSEILSGKRRLTPKTALRIIDALDIPEHEKQDFMSFMEFTRNRKRTLLTEDTHELLTHWIYFALLSTLDLDSGPASSEELAQRLGVVIDDVVAALEKLQSHHLVTKVGDNYQSVHKALSSTDNIPSEEIVRAHQRNLSLAKASLTALPQEVRDFTGLTFSGDSKKLDLAKKLIRDFMDRLATELCDGDLDQVYQLNLQLFPLVGWEKPK